MENLSLTIYWIISSFTPSCIIRKKKPLMPSPILAIKLQGFPLHCSPHCGQNEAAQGPIISWLLAPDLFKAVNISEIHSKDTRQGQGKAAARREATPGATNTGRWQRQKRGSQSLRRRDADVGPPFGPRIIWAQAMKRRAARLTATGTRGRGKAFPKLRAARLGADAFASSVPSSGSHCCSPSSPRLVRTRYMSHATYITYHIRGRCKSSFLYSLHSSVETVFTSFHLKV